MGEKQDFVLIAYTREIIRTKTAIDLGEDLEEMKRKNKGEWPEDYIKEFVKVKNYI